MEERLIKVENKVESLDCDVQDLKVNMASLSSTCAASMSAITQRVEDAMKNYDKMVTLVKWVVVVTVTVIAALAGIKIVIPSL
jgi:hypothetical protein